jgi:hypothetical protein
MNASIGASENIATPPGSNGFFASLLAGPALPALAARLGAKIAAWFGDPIRFGDIGDRRAPCQRDGGAASRPRLPDRAGQREAHRRGQRSLCLGMDRSATLVLERGALYQALAEVDFAPIRRAIEDEAQKRRCRCGRRDRCRRCLRPADRRPYRHRTVRHPRFRRADTFMDVARAIFGHVFLNLSDDETIRQRALKAAGLMEAVVQRRDQAAACVRRFRQRHDGRADGGRDGRR